MKLNLLGEWLSWFEYQQDYTSEISSTFDYDYNNYIDQSNHRGSLDSLSSFIDGVTNSDSGSANRKFVPQHELCERDLLIIDMLNSASTSEGTTTVSFCVTDPSLPDNPVIFVSDGFCQLTGYKYEEVVGQNCRFLQGPLTKKEDVCKIKDAVKEEKECTVRLLNYRKDGSTFWNEFYLAQLRSPSQKVAYYIGIQAAVDVNEDGTNKTLCVTDEVPSNPGMKYSISSNQVSYNSKKSSWLV